MLPGRPSVSPGPLRADPQRPPGPRSAVPGRSQITLSRPQPPSAALNGPRTTPRPLRNGPRATPRPPLNGPRSHAQPPATASEPPPAAPQRPSQSLPAPPQRPRGTSSTPEGHPGRAVRCSSVVIRCSITCRVTAALHRFGDFLPSTSWGLRSCPELCPQGSWLRGFCPAQGPVESWTSGLHRLWTTPRSTTGPGGCPPTPHRFGAVVPSDRPLLHSAVHCSATRRPCSRLRVKGVTGSCRVGVWETGVFLGTQLGRTALSLWALCAELSVLHRRPRLSTGSTHRAGG